MADLALLPGDVELPWHPSLLHPRTGEPVRAVFRTARGRVVWPVMGGAEDDPDDDGDDPGDPGDDDGDGDGDDGDGSDEPKGKPREYKPPTQAEFARMQRQISRLNTTNKRLKEGGKPDPKKAEDADEALEQAKASARAEVKAPAIKAVARGLLSSMNLRGKPDRVLRMLDLDDLDLDPKTGDVDGLQDQLDDIKDEYPDLFDDNKTRRQKRDRGDAAANTAGRDSKSNTDRLAAAVMRGVSGS